jgi:hypothetical protein
VGRDLSRGINMSVLLSQNMQPLVYIDIILSAGRCPRATLTPDILFYRSEL